MVKLISTSGLDSRPCMMHLMLLKLLMIQQYSGVMKFGVKEQKVV